MPQFGAVLQGPGSLVRVFAPNATSVKICGDWNGWAESTAIDLVRNGDFWEGPGQSPHRRRPLRATRRPAGRVQPPPRPGGA